MNTSPRRRVVPAATPVRALTLTGPPAVELRLRVDCPDATPARVGGTLVDVVPAGDRYRGGVVL